MTEEPRESHLSLAARNSRRISASPAELAEQLTLAGLEVESIDTGGAAVFRRRGRRGAGVGAPSGCVEKLSLCQVTTDGKNRLQIVCGASNVRAGLKVAVAMVGARLPNDVTIKRATLRGLESNGMLCSARELGLGDEHDGIMELSDSLPLNQDVREALDLDDSVLEVNATPNRGDCMSVFGIARDYAAAQERRYSTAVRRSGRSRGTTVLSRWRSSPPACPMFASRVIRGVRPNAQSPGMAARALAPRRHQQHFGHRRCHQLRDDGVGTADARL